MHQEGKQDFCFDAHIKIEKERINMSKFCSACEELKANAPHFVLNGITDRECESLQNNTGLNSSVPGNNCGDLNDMLGCLLGALHEKLPAYDICDIKDFIDQLMANLRNMQHAMICSDCGQWTQIGLIWQRIQQIENRLTSLENRVTNIEREMARQGDVLLTILNHLRNIGVWTPGNDASGGFVLGRGIAGGNINLFSGTRDGGHWIRTNGGQTENDLAGGV